MKTIYTEVKQALEKSSKGRERRNKNRFIGYLIWNKYHLDDQPLDADLLEKIIVDSASYDRLWRLVTLENPELRGSDYDTKEKVEQEVELSLGYQPGVVRDIKKVGEIAKPYKE